MTEHPLFAEMHRRMVSDVAKTYIVGCQACDWEQPVPAQYNESRETAHRWAEGTGLKLTPDGPLCNRCAASRTD